MSRSDRAVADTVAGSGPADLIPFATHREMGGRTDMTRVTLRHRTKRDEGAHVRNRRGRGRGVLAAFLLAALVSGCDSFFEVDLPGRLVAEDLNDPALAENLALAVQGDLECGFRGYLFNDVLWSGVGTYLGAYREWFLTEQRSIGKQDGGNGDCTHIRRPAWLPMHIVRNQADVAIELIGGFADGDVGDRDYLMAKAYVYGGYATEFLAEHYCAVVFGGDGVERSREEGFEAAAELFTSGLELARGASHSDAGRLRNLALVGRAGRG